jgi:signal transduction histidine kinase
MLKNLSIRSKLTAITLLASGIALVLACGAFLAYDLIAIRSEMIENLEIVAEILGSNSTAALAFNDPKAAEETLGALKAQPAILAGCIFTKDGKRFAIYRQAGVRDDLFPTSASRPCHVFRENRLELQRAIVHDGKYVGMVCIESNLDPMYVRVRQYLLIFTVVLAASTAVAFAIAFRLQRFISTPILSLAEVAKTVSAEKNYNLRAAWASRDELGVLVEGFNEMLSEIQERDDALRRAHDELEQRVHERTQELRDEIQVRTKAEAELKATASQLERSNRELQDFAHMASHDLQEPLRKVRAFGDRLKAKCAGVLSEEGLDYLNRMQSAAARMQSLIEGLLSFSRVATKAMPFLRVDMGSVAREVLSDLEARTEQTGGRVEVGSLPTLDADPTQMRQLLQNLIGNGLKFHRPDVPPVVRVRGELIDGGARCRITVEDNGVGFDEKYRDRLFNVFQRLHSRTEFEGTGIGLAVCRKIVERHGGTIEASSAINEGSRFTVVLPVCPNGGEQPHG